MKKLEENIRDSALEKFRNNKEIRFIMILPLVSIILGIIFEGKTFLSSYYPYIILMVGILALVLIRDYKIGMLIFLFTVTALLPIQLIYYKIIPVHENYVPINIPGTQQIFQMFGKFHMVYYPNYPTEGDTIVGFIDICDNGLTNCTKLNNYSISAYFIDEGNVKHQILEKTNINESFSLPYYGRPIHISFFHSNTPAFSEYILPKPSFSQSVLEVLSKHPIVTLLSLISSIISLWSIIEIFRKIKDKYKLFFKHNKKFLKKS